LNIRATAASDLPTGDVYMPVAIRYGYPLCYAASFTMVSGNSPNPKRELPSIELSELHRYHYHSYPSLAANIAIGLLAVAVLTFASRHLLRAIVAGLRAFLSKPPPDNEEGPKRASESV